MWLVLEPRDYLSTYVKLGTIAVLVIGVFVVHPNIQFPNFTRFIHGGGPIIKGNAVSLSLRDHRLRRDLRLSFAGFFGHDSEDAGQGNRCALHRLRRDDRRIAGGPAGSDCRMLDVSGRLLRHQHHAAGVQPPRLEHREPGYVLPRGRRELSGTHRRRGFSGRRHGANLPRAFPAWLT